MRGFRTSSPYKISSSLSQEAIKRQRRTDNIESAFFIFVIFYDAKLQTLSDISNADLSLKSIYEESSTLSVLYEVSVCDNKQRIKFRR